MARRFAQIEAQIKKLQAEAAALREGRLRQVKVTAEGYAER